MDEQDAGELFRAMFEEPTDFRPPPPPPKSATFDRRKENVGPGEPQSITLRLVGSHPLWGHFLWNASILFSHYMDSRKSLCRQKCVLELGAGAALPSVIATINGATKVVATDYPDLELIDNIAENMERLFQGPDRSRISVKGFVWGADASPLLSELPDGRKFDLIILCDLIFNTQAHHALLRTCRDCLADGSQIFCAFSLHRPRLAEQDMNFFKLAEDPPYDFSCEKLFEEKMELMFEKDRGDAEIRRTVHVYCLVPRQRR